MNDKPVTRERNPVPRANAAPLKRPDSGRAASALGQPKPAVRPARARAISLDANARAVALNVLQDMSRQDAYASLALDKRLTESKLDERDKEFAARVVYGVTETRLRLDWTIDMLLRDPENIDSLTRDLLRIGAYQILFMDRVPDHAATYETVSVAKTLPASLPFAGLINATLHRLIEQRDSIKLPADPVENLSIRASWPIWIIQRLIEAYGADTARAIALYHSDPRVTTIRMNGTRITKEAFEKRLTDSGRAWTPALLPGAYRVRGIGAVGADPLYRGGYYSVMGESSMLAVEAIGVRRGMRILDACAAPGGKTMLIAERMQGTGRVIAWDIHEHRVELLRAQAGRLSLDNIRPVVRDATKPYPDGFQTMDAVLIDAPCSGLGVALDKPDAKYRLTPERLAELINTQRALLSACAPLVKPGGTLVYSTCTLLPEENGEQVREFLEAHPEFSLDNAPVAGFAPGSYGTQLLAHRDHVEGFFFTRMIRVK
ncbi:MAG: 16S rRNA (cytosine(967)-C(5))-methyltransferase RsmB [Oscillospiraceae bacterium]|jgi:16S rRNA (cytosine967-C5)-methyltransferase|nr:16S rRNA (cytosine(967)-C(5))-methyltransferase RsmB [Oscillospiraceae bacterium]